MEGEGGAWVRETLSGRVVGGKEKEGEGQGGGGVDGKRKRKRKRRSEGGWRMRGRGREVRECVGGKWGREESGREEGGGRMEGGRRGGVGWGGGMYKERIERRIQMRYLGGRVGVRGMEGSVIEDGGTREADVCVLERHMCMMM